MPIPRTGNKNRKTASIQSRTAPGTKKHKPGHKSKSTLPLISGRKWNKIRLKLMIEALKTKTSLQADAQVNEMMKANYRLARSGKGR